MNTENNNQMIKKEENLFLKIKDFFKRLFYRKSGSNETIVAEESKEVPQINNAFMRTIKEEEYSERERLLRLQQSFREGKITQGDLTEEDIEKLSKLYDEQIERLKIQIEECKQRIENKKKKLQKV